MARASAKSAPAAPDDGELTAPNAAPLPAPDADTDAGQDTATAAGPGAAPGADDKPSAASLLDAIAGPEQREVVRVFRLNDEGVRGSMLFQVAAGIEPSALMARIKAHGPGDYELQAAVRGQYSGRPRRVCIEPEARNPEAEAPTANARPSAWEPPAWMSPLLAPVILKVTDALLNKPAPPPPPASGFTFDNAMALMTLLMKQRGPEPRDAIEEATRTLALLRELKAEAGGNEGGSVFEKLAETLATTVAAVPKQPPPRQAPPAARPAVVARLETPPATPPPASTTEGQTMPAVPSTTPPADPQTDTADDPMQRLGAILVRMAEQGADLAQVRTVMGTVMEPDEFEAAEAQLFDNVDQLHLAGLLFPGLASHTDWLRGIADQVRAEQRQTAAGGQGGTVDA